ncbi:hypothetical protein Dda_0115 [Drechslerella dactyloides]|uniref:Uncharacterized protein n=1 Tax=Drechslerella dactyloides TaxID=74499 RepID=A0AAD6NMT5_DREDA|nr:hypothetical protein Dda_0115 [Drechslerella dactyloides]
MPSFTQIIIAAIAAAAAVSASPVAAVKELAARGDTNYGNCWGAGSAGTDAGVKGQGWCDGRTWTEAAFDVPFAFVAGNPINIVTESHVSFGPWHCCNTCRPEDNCIGWKMTSDCQCTTFKADTATAGTVTLGVYGGPYTNTSGKFHRSGPKYNLASTPFGNGVFTPTQ